MQRKRKKQLRKQPASLHKTELFSDPFLNQNWDDLLFKDELAMTLSDPFLNQPIATETFDLTPLLGDPFLNDNLDPIAMLLGEQLFDPIAMLRDDPLLDPELLEATTKLIMDDELVQLDLNWWLAQIEDEKSILFATFEAMQANLDLGIILSTMREFANCLPTFVENEATPKR